MTSIRNAVPRALALPNALTIALLAAALGASGCYDCLYCDDVNQVEGWVEFNFVRAGGSEPLAGLAVVFNTEARSFDRTTNAEGRVVFQDLAGSTLNFTIGLPAGYTFESPLNGQVTVTFAADTTSTVVAVNPPGT